MRKLFFIVAISVLSCFLIQSFVSPTLFMGISNDGGKLQIVMQAFDTEYRALNIPSFGFDYRVNFQNISTTENLELQEIFFNQLNSALKKIDRKALLEQDKIYFDQIDYEIRLNKERISLEKEFRIKDAGIPNNGLQPLPKEWYQYYIHFFTGVHITPEELFQFGEGEVSRVQQEIKNIQKQLGFENNNSRFYQHLQSEDFFIHDKQAILKKYNEIEFIVRRSMNDVFRDTAISDLDFMEWPDAGQFTPPGYYSSTGDNAYGTAVFFFNFYEGRHNKRSMEWLFMHEGIPGHHYQSCIREKQKNLPAFKELFYYPGNFEGWGAYVEYLGKDVGLYSDVYSYLGKWEWDLVRSVRILIDVGIHHYGWSKQEALDCWKKHIQNQDEIAEREVIRCTTWPAQALSYKVGAWKIQELAEKMKKENPKKFSLAQFHDDFLSMGQVPLEVIEKNLSDN